VIGVAGGIGAGKTLVARQLASLGAKVVDADGIAKQMLDDADVKTQLVGWWGEKILDGEGRVDLRQVAGVIFADPQQRHRLEGLIHPRVAEQRDRILAAAQADPQVTAVVIDAPLLYEVGWDKLCDRVIYVHADRALRVSRETEDRGWDEQELDRREKIQLSLDKKLQRAHDIVDNNSTETECLAQVRDVLSRILATK
jgi:dephospho-CoA kinase